MKQDLTLLIMAAGAGSRFGGLKQIEAFGPSGEFIIDYSVYDAIKAGFTKVVFIIKEENYELFKDTIGSRVEDKIKVEYAFQDIHDLPNGFKPSLQRIKPFGTGHAILSARNLINEPFGVINADDFYGRDSFKKLADFLKNNNNDKNYAAICFPVSETMSEIGSVKRGICNHQNGYLQEIIESTILKEDNKIKATPLNKEEYREIEPSTLVSVNMFGFFPSIFTYLEKNLLEFLEKNSQDLTAEFLIPDVLQNGIKENDCLITVLSSTSTWMGVTYKEDVPDVKNKLNILIKNNEYPEKLWNTHS